MEAYHTYSSAAVHICINVARRGDRHAGLLRPRAYADPPERTLSSYRLDQSSIGAYRA